MNGKIGVFSFFAGAGFLDLGFEKTGLYETLFVNEFHKPFMEVYKGSRIGLNIRQPQFGYDTSDITEFLSQTNTRLLLDHLKDAKKNYNLAGFIGGPPCPDFSIGGKNRGKEGENGRLSGTYIELILRTKPDFFLFENVKGLYRTKKHRLFFDDLKRKLVKAGYCITEKLINAIEFGVPQDRQRIILIGFQRSVLNDLGFKLNGSPAIENFNWHRNTLFKSDEVFSENWPGIEPFVQNSVKSRPVSIPIELTVEYWFKKNDVENHPNAEHYFKPRAGIVKFKSISEGDDLKKSYKRLHRWRYSPTAAYGNNEVHLHPYKERRISVAEALAIQSLPKEFVIPEHISLTDMFKTIGNGVPYLAAKGLAQNIADFIYNNPVKDIETPYAETNREQYCLIH